eukprot:GAHX01000471.1.p1 GENE.GAHX01000471.1~~GAHX01000471.1.p1  ORF type:complete len:270 (+),score=67.09 GAHX01000471.1:542-1351(+)
MKIEREKKNANKRNDIRNKEKTKVEVTNKNPTNFNSIEATKPNKKNKTPANLTSTNLDQFQKEIQSKQTMANHQRTLARLQNMQNQVLCHQKEISNNREYTKIDLSINDPNNTPLNTCLEYNDHLKKEHLHIDDKVYAIMKGTNSDYSTPIQSNPVVSNDRVRTKKKMFVKTLSQVITKDPNEESSDSVIAEEENSDDDNNEDFNHIKDNHVPRINVDEVIKIGTKNYMKLSKETKGGLQPNLSEGNKTRLEYKVDSNNMEFPELDDEN